MRVRSHLMRVGEEYLYVFKPRPPGAGRTVAGRRTPPPDGLRGLWRGRTYGPPATRRQGHEHQTL